MKLCWLGIHKYSKWQETERGKIAAESLHFKGQAVVGRYLVQERKCSNCNKVEIETQRKYTA